METTTEKLKHIKVDCLYGKKKHFNAADRKEKYHYWIGIPLTAINILIVTVLFFVLTDRATSWVKYLPIFLAFIASFLSGFQTYFNFNRQVEGHRRIANRYLALMKKADRLQGYIKDNLVSPEDAIKQFETISDLADEINKDAEQFPASEKDYKKAQLGVVNGEEEYTDKELNL
jgi:hypothetical protein